MSNSEFRFKVEPKEDLVSREERWDAAIAKLQAQGLTIKGTGPDGDYPVRYAFNEAGDMTFDEWMTQPGASREDPWFEVYNTVPLAAGEWTTNDVAFKGDPAIKVDA